MHIKNITIAGFKTYREQTFEVPFSARHNVVVGKNGSGKSNFFNAIMFVLSEKYSTLRPNERKDLLHAGAGSPSMSAYVEITFDNSDGRLVLPGMSEDAEVRIRRTVGVQKDEFRVNDKGISHQDVRQLLESAGFSASNPYYVVEQGRIVHLTNMGEAERLDLLKEVAGTKVYEDRRAESNRILEETTEKRTRIEETVGKLRARLGELESEREEWKRYQSLEKKRKGLEYTLYSQEANTVQAQIELLERSKKEITGKYDGELAKTNQVHMDTKAAERQVVELARQIQGLENQRKVIDAERIDIIKERAKLDLTMAEAKGAMGAGENEKKKLEKDLGELLKAFEKGKKDLDLKQKQLVTKSDVTEKAETALISTETLVAALQAKRGRRRTFKTKQERDKWLKDEIAKNEDFATKHKKDISKITEQEKAVGEALATDEATVSKNTTDVEKADTEILQKEQARLAALKQRDALHTERRELFQNINEAETKLRRFTEERERMQGYLDKALGSHEIRQGLASVEACVAEMEKAGDRHIRKAVHGPVIGLIKCDPRFFTAVEVTVGNALYNVIVDTFDTSAKILDFMNRNKRPGRVTFLPLDTCHGKNKDIPTTSTVTPLIAHIEYNEKYKGITAELFGKTAVASSLKEAAEASKQYDCDAVTLDGDQVNRKGGIHGGYMARASRLQAYADSKKIDTEKEAAAKEVQALKTKLADVEGRMAAALQTVETTAGQSSALRETVQEERRATRHAYERIARHQQQIAALKESKVAAQRALTEAHETAKALTAEMQSDFKAEFGEDEERELERLLSQVTSERADASKKKTDSVTCGTEVSVLEENLATMRKRVDAIQERISVLSHSAVHVDNAHLSAEDKAVSTELASLEARISKIDTEVNALTKQKQKAEEKVQEQQSQEAGMARAFRTDKEELEKYNSKRALLAQQLEDAQTKIRRLGAIPTDTAQHDGVPAGKLMQQLKQCREELRSFAHVNKKALEQYTALAEGHEDLCAKQKVNEKELTAIHEMMIKLDAQKDEAIERTVKQVQFQFEKVFLELVTAPGASAELQLLKAKDTKKKGVDAYIGVRIKVCFGLGSAVTELTQLSGGQKSLVALSLIFAIQRCDPAPFYLFDEIDAALDEDYRSSVARLISRQSEGAQFITATFKSEMVDCADKVYGIAFRNKVSKIQEISKDEANNLLKQAAFAEKRVRESEA